MTLLAKSFGAALRQLREGAGLSQDAFALTCGVHRTYIGRVERGEANVGLENIDRLARALGVRGSDLLRAAESHAAHPRPEMAAATSVATGGMDDGPALEGHAQRRQSALPKTRRPKRR